MLGAVGVVVLAVGGVELLGELADAQPTISPAIAATATIARSASSRERRLVPVMTAELGEALDVVMAEVEQVRRVMGAQENDVMHGGPPRGSGAGSPAFLHRRRARPVCRGGDGARSL